MVPSPTRAILTLALVVALITFVVPHQPKPAFGSIVPRYPDPERLVDVTRTVRSTPPLETPVLAVVVNHHLLAAEYIADSLHRAVRPGVRRIVLLSPNHFASGRGWVHTTDRGFATPFGAVPADAAAVAELVSSEGFRSDPEPFRGEHGILNLLPFLALEAPGVPVVPILTKDGAPSETVDALARALDRIVDSRTLVVASLDFSHGTDVPTADTNDARSLRVLRSLDTVGARSAAVDSPATLEALLWHVAARGARRFVLLHHGNSGRLTATPEAQNVTSYITGAFTYLTPPRPVPD